MTFCWEWFGILSWTNNRTWLFPFSPIRTKLAANLFQENLNSLQHPIYRLNAYFSADPKEKTNYMLVYQILKSYFLHKTRTSSSWNSHVKIKYHLLVPIKTLVQKLDWLEHLIRPKMRKVFENVLNKATNIQVEKQRRQVKTVWCYIFLPSRGRKTNQETIKFEFRWGFSLLLHIQSLFLKSIFFDKPKYLELSAPELSKFLLYESYYQKVQSFAKKNSIYTF